MKLCNKVIEKPKKLKFRKQKRHKILLCVVSSIAMMIYNSKYRFVIIQLSFSWKYYTACCSIPVHGGGINRWTNGRTDGLLDVALHQTDLRNFFVFFYFGFLPRLRPRILFFWCSNKRELEIEFFCWFGIPPQHHHGQKIQSHKIIRKGIFIIFSDVVFIRAVVVVVVVVVIIIIID